MALILNIETATSLCSVALAENSKVIAMRETFEEKSHASNLTVFIDQMLKENNLRVADLDAVAVGKGPGSYTGLRIGVSTAKGICYGAGIPLIAINTLKIMFRQVVGSGSENIGNAQPETLYCPMIDARRMEVFTCVYDCHGNEKEQISAKIVDIQTFQPLLELHPMVFFGSGMPKCREYLEHPHSIFVPDIHPGASSLAGLAEIAYQSKEFENIAYFEPYYLKDFIATKSKKGLFV